MLLEQRSIMLDQLIEIINYNFSNRELLEEALTHPSTSYVKKCKNYQRLEFLGDSILSAIIADMLFMKFPNENEGDLSKRHIELVKGKTLSHLAKAIGLGNYMLMSEGEKNNGGAQNLKNLENTMEALIGAIYVDSDFERTKEFVGKYWKTLMLSMEVPPDNAKSKLQEWTQSRNLGIPTYKVIKRTGPSHEPLFTIEISLEGFKAVVVTAKNKRSGEQLAAEIMLQNVLEEA